MFNKAVIFCASIVLLLTVGIFYIQTQSVEAQSTGPAALEGYVWSSNYGWIHLNPTYGGVKIDSNGDFSGYAWANPRDEVAGTNNIGWISFQEVAGCPSGTCRPHVDFSTGAVTGWAKVLSTGEWISLSGINHNSPVSNGTGGVTFNTSTKVFNGYAWGGTTDSSGRVYGAGWISFNTSPVTCPNCGGEDSSLRVSCSGSPLAATIGQEVTWTAIAENATNTVSYSWSGTQGLIGTANPIEKTYTASGTKDATILISSGGATTSASCSVNVSGQCSTQLRCEGGNVYDECTGNTINCTLGCSNGACLPEPECNDGSDNDGDGYADFDGNDPGCDNSSDNDEYDANGTTTPGTTTPKVDLKIKKLTGTNFVNSNNLEVAKGDSAVIQWETANINSCTLSSRPFGVLADTLGVDDTRLISGTKQVDGLQVTTWFDMTCYSGANQIKDSIRIIVKNSTEN